MADNKTGRPPKGDGPSFPVEEVDRLLVHGEPKEVADGQAEGVRYPSYRELGERYGVAHSLIARYSQQHNCLARRKQIEKQVQQLSDEKLVELRADALAFSRDDQVRTIDRYLVKFEESVAEGRTRFDSPSDFNLMCRLRAFLMGEAESRHEVHSDMPTLEDLQQRHKQMLEDERASAAVVDPNDGADDAGESGAALTDDDADEQDGAANLAGHRAVG